MDSPEDGDAAASISIRRPAQQAPIWPKVATDYHGALVRLATMRAAGKQYLLFGYVELFPRDIPVPERFTAGEKPWAVPNFGGDVTLRHRRCRCPPPMRSPGTKRRPSGG